MSVTVSQIKGREILDSRGNPTVEVEISLSDGAFGRAMVPSGASKGQREALELRDGDGHRFLGKGVLKAVAAISEKIAPALRGTPLHDLKSLDKLLLDLDGTSQKEKLGANAVLGVSLAGAHALAQSRRIPLFKLINGEMGLAANDFRMPVPLMNILNGGVHANNGLEIQEFMIVPHGFELFSEALRAGVEIFHHLKKKLHDKNLSTAVGDEGGFAPALRSNVEAIELICQSISAAGYEAGRQVSIALDVAASSFFDEHADRYTLGTREELTSFYGDLIGKYPIVSIEDGLQENDWSGWQSLTDRYGDRVQLVGDDLFVTQAQWVKKGIAEKVANAVLIKVNQVGTLTETFETMALCRRSDYRCVVSHRSGETEDTTIAHLAVGSGCGQIKTGSASRSERTAKYNELLRIEEWARETGTAIPFARAFNGAKR